MKFLKFSLIFLLLIICISKSQQSEVSMSSTDVDLKEYPLAILNQLNIYRKHQHFSPFIKWDKILALSADKEAQSIITANSFGKHSNFYNWKKSIDNKYFTEMQMEVDTEGQIPSKLIFAKAVLEALQKEQSWFLVHGYTIGGISIKPIPNKKNIYIIVIHLARSSQEKKLSNLFKKLNKGLKTKTVTTKKVVKVQKAPVKTVTTKKVVKVQKAPIKKKIVKTKTVIKPQKIKTIKVKNIKNIKTNKIIKKVPKIVQSKKGKAIIKRRKIIKVIKKPKIVKSTTVKKQKIVKNTTVKKPKIVQNTTTKIIKTIKKPVVVKKSIIKKIITKKPQLKISKNIKVKR